MSTKTGQKKLREKKITTLVHSTNPSCFRHFECVNGGNVIKMLSQEENSTFNGVCCAIFTFRNLSDKPESAYARKQFTSSHKHFEKSNENSSSLAHLGCSLSHRSTGVFKVTVLCVYCKGDAEKCHRNQT